MFSLGHVAWMWPATAATRSSNVVAMRRAWIVVALVLAACSSTSSDGRPTKQQLVEALMQPDTAGLDEQDADCVADELLRSGLSDGELREFVEKSGEDDLPSRLEVYTDARRLCDQLDSPGITDG